AVISGIAWDHINVFPTFGEYIAQFDKFIETIIPGGKLIYCENDIELRNIVINSKANIERFPYAIPAHEVIDGVTYLLPQRTALNVFGDHNLMNLNAAKLVCEELGINNVDFAKAISSFAGAAKRLELLNSSKGTNVYKDFAHSPSKLKATLDAVKAQFGDRKLVACIELHTFSSLNKTFLAEYKNTMDDADVKIVYIDEKTFIQKKMEPFNEIDVRTSFNDNDILFFSDAGKLEAYLRNLNFSNTNLLLMSSGNYGGMDLVKLASELDM
ncbi:MAG: peptidoglycan synthetase, partial [Pedobacter sp.]